jgi:mono/diheme cytochrome c family protein
MTSRRVPLGFVAVALLLAGVTAAVGAGSRSAGARPASPEAVKRGAQLYTSHCAACHGAAGKGDGESAAGLPIKPQDLTEGRLLNALPDHWMERLLREGGAGVGLSPLMPGFERLLSDAQRGDVLAYVRSLAEPPYDPARALAVPRERSGPVQPIFFSHLIHAGSFKIECRYCHSGAARGPAATIPSVATCMGCHKIVAAQGNPEIAKLHEYWQRQEPIPWERIFKVPEYVRFPHKPHVRAAVACQTCHGPIEAMERVSARTGQSLPNDLLNLVGLRPDPPKLTMGWCIDCHRAALAEGKQAPLECVACHH